MGRVFTTIGLAAAACAATSLAAMALEPLVRQPGYLQAAITSEPPDVERRQQRSQSESCRRWRTIASRLGETYAGHRLRETVVARACALTGLEGHEDELWQWPWRNGDVRAEPPPRLHGQIGAWVIRCGKAGRRQRCAMLHDFAHEGAADGGGAGIVSHFVIDTIGGRESVIWRVLVPGADAARDRIEVAIGGKRAAKGFLACGKPGCLMEADVRLSAEAANLLWDGAPLDVTVVRDNRPLLTSQLSGHGYRAALSELARLRREEGRTLATRR